MWAAQSFLLYGGEPTLSNQIPIINRGGVDSQGNRSYLGKSGAQESHQMPQMFISTPMPNAVGGNGVNRLIENSAIQRPFAGAQYPLSPSKISVISIITLFSVSLYNLFSSLQPFLFRWTWNFPIK